MRGEYAAAVYFARKKRMGMVMNTTVGSTIQVALLVALLLAVIFFFTGHPMRLVFPNPLELVAIAQDGQTTWSEGRLLIALYVLFGLAFLLSLQKGINYD